jgi:hypothetical protein
MGESCNTQKKSIMWKHPLCPPVKKFRATPSVRIVVATVFRNHKGATIVDTLAAVIMSLLRVLVVHLRGQGTSFIPKCLGCSAKPPSLCKILPTGLVTDKSDALPSLQF